MFRGIKRWFFKVLGVTEVAKILVSAYNIVRPMYDGVAYVLDQLQSGKITEIMIAYVSEVKTAIESVLALIKKAAGFFEVELPDKPIVSASKDIVDAQLQMAKRSETVGTSIADMVSARKDADLLLKS